MKTTTLLGLWVITIARISVLAMAECVFRHLLVFVIVAVAASVLSYGLGRWHAWQTRRLWPRPVAGVGGAPVRALAKVRQPHLEASGRGP